jgi:hypothetical protein
VQNIEIHLSVLKELQKFLVQFSEEIRIKSDEYNRRINQLQEIEVAVQIADYYEANYAMQNIQLLQNLIANITDVCLPQINANIAKLEQTLIWRDTAGNIVAKQIGDRIWDNSGNWVYEIRGNRIYDSSGNWRFEFRGDDRIYDTLGNWLALEY